jgi:hypothetical protein
MRYVCRSARARNEGRRGLGRLGGDLAVDARVRARVSVIVECPRVSWTTFAGTPAASMSDAAPCRRSCSRIGGSFAAAAKAWNNTAAAGPSACSSRTPTARAGSARSTWRRRPARHRRRSGGWESRLRRTDRLPGWTACRWGPGAWVSFRGFPAPKAEAPPMVGGPAPSSPVHLKQVSATPSSRRRSSVGHLRRVGLERARPERARHIEPAAVDPVRHRPLDPGATI